MSLRHKKCGNAAYICPSYTSDEPRTKIFCPEGYGDPEAIEKIFLDQE